MPARGTFDLVHPHPCTICAIERFQRRSREKYEGRKTLRWYTADQREAFYVEIHALRASQFIGMFSIMWSDLCVESVIGSTLELHKTTGNFFSKPPFMSVHIISLTSQMGLVATLRIII
eukprot:scaffold426_cov319-Pavlova_lutheri.AAC.28